MNRQQIIKAVTEKTGISRKDTAKVFSSIFETILESLEKEESVRLMNFGSFTVKTYKPRKGYNPASKIVVQLPERKAISQTCSFKKLKIITDKIQSLNSFSS